MSFIEHFQNLLGDLCDENQWSPNNWWYKWTYSSGLIEWTNNWLRSNKICKNYKIKWRIRKDTMHMAVIVQIYLRTSFASISVRVRAWLFMICQRHCCCFFVAGGFLLRKPISTHSDARRLLYSYRLTEPYARMTLPLCSLFSYFTTKRRYNEIHR